MFFIAHTHNAIGRFYEVMGYGPDNRTVSEQSPGLHLVVAKCRNQTQKLSIIVVGDIIWGAAPGEPPQYHR
jgi:hypothetical protein